VPCDDGFSASVDGKPTRIYEANLGLSAVFVNAGRHDIQFSFFPRGMKAGIVVSVLCLVLLLLLSWLTKDFAQGGANSNASSTSGYNIKDTTYKEVK